jgi:dienelactone hydrolase
MGLTNRTRLSIYLSYKLLTIVYCLIAITPVYAQVKKEDSRTAIPEVSSEVYQSIVQFYEYDHNIPLDARIVSDEVYQGASMQKIVFKGIYNSQVPSLLIVPKDSLSAHPVVLIADGYGGSKDWWVDDENFSLGGLVTKALLKSGFAVMICDAVYHGERNYENEFSGPPHPFEYPNTGRKMIIQTAIEYRRAMDYLATRVDIDNSRIGMMGVSMGGFITFALSSIDSRIKSSVAGLTPVLKEFKYQAIASSTFASRIRTNSFLMFIGSKDTYYTIREARQIYDRIPVKVKDFIEYDTGHYVTKEYAGMVANWFTKNL